ncbi:MAG: phosphatidylglycerophosphatase A [Bacteroidota bacterium]
MIGSDRRDDGSGSQPLRFLTRFLATGMCVGLIPWASGTFGTLVGLLVCLIPGVHPPSTLVLLILVGFAIGVYAAGEVAREEGHRLTRSAAAAKAVFQPGRREHPDPSIVVIDEIVGMWIALLGLPPSIVSFAAAFIAFRVFDVLKPEPATMVERLPGGWGIMLDDVVAGVYANVLVRVILFLLTLMPGTGVLA